MANPLDLSAFITDRTGSQVIQDLFRWQEEAFDLIFKTHPELSPTLRYGQHVPLHYLSMEQQVQQVGAWRRASGINDVLLGLASQNVSEPPPQILEKFGATRGREIHNITSKLREFVGLEAKAPYYKMPISYEAGDNPLNAYYASLNINFDVRPRDLRAGVAEVNKTGAATSAMHFGPGSNRIRTISQASLDMPSVLREGATFTSFDIETAGLMSGQIREVAYRQGIVRAGGELTVGPSQSLIFDPLAVRRGTVGQVLGDRVNAVPLGQFLRQGQNVSDDFAKSMLPFLEAARTSDYLVGHNIGGFDIPQILEQLTETAAYKSEAQDIIPGFKSLVDTTFEGIDKKIVDTLTLASRARNLGELGIAPELLRAGETRPYSISNILLETDLLKKMEGSGIADLIKTQGLHNADVDDAVTRGLLRHLHSLTLTPLDKPDIRLAITSAAAITPTTHAALHTDISDTALRHLIANVEGGIKIPIDESSPVANRKLAQLIEQAQGRGGSSTAVEEAFQLIRHGGTRGISYKINPIEQEIYETRHLGLGASEILNFDPSSYIFNNNMYDTMAGVQTGRKAAYQDIISGQRPEIPAGEFSIFQETMHDMRMPFSGLSREERRFGTALSHLTRNVDTREGMRKVSRLLSDVGVSNFELFDPMRADYATQSGNVSLPVHFLQDQNMLDQGSLLDLSVVDRTAYNEKNAVNLIHNLDTKQREAFATRLEELARDSDEAIMSAMGIGPPSASTDADIMEATSRFRKAVERGDILTNIREHGRVAIGQLYDDQADPVIDLIRQLNGGDVYRDTSRLRMRLPFMDIYSRDPTRGTGVIRTASAILNKGLTEGNLAEIGIHTRNTEKIAQGFLDLALDKKNAHALQAANLAADMGLGDRATQTIKDAFGAYQKIRPKIPELVGATVLGMFAVHEYRKHKENEPYNEAFDRMPANDNRRYYVADLLQAKMDSGVNLYSQKYDPLSTAYVVDNLNSNKIGHTIMSWNRDSNLYGGVL